MTLKSHLVDKYKLNMKIKQNLIENKNDRAEDSMSGNRL